MSLFSADLWYIESVLELRFLHTNEKIKKSINNMEIMLQTELENSQTNQILRYNDTIVVLTESRIQHINKTPDRGQKSLDFWGRRKI